MSFFELLVLMLSCRLTFIKRECVCVWGGVLDDLMLVNKQL